MIRLIVIMLGSILLISVVRSIIGIIMKGFAEMVGGGAANRTAPRAETQVPVGGELKRDPVCGTYVSTTSSVKKTVGGQVLHFCSAECRDKHKA